MRSASKRGMQIGKGVRHGLPDGMRIKEKEGIFAKTADTVP